MKYFFVFSDTFLINDEDYERNVFKLEDIYLPEIVKDLNNK